MQLPEIFARGGVLIQLLNTLGLGVLATGLIVYYRALLSRSDNLRESLTDLRDAHQKVISAMERRAKDIDERFEDEKKFRSLHMSLLEDVEVYRVKVSAWRNDELTILQGRLREMTNRLDTVEIEYARLKLENNELRISMAQLESKYKSLDFQDNPSGTKGLT
jgi:hypothetical protein